MMWRILLLMLVGWIQREQAAVIEYLNEENRLIEPMATIPDINLPVMRQDRLGGLLSFYHHEAA